MPAIPRRQCLLSFKVSNRVSNAAFVTRRGRATLTFRRLEKSNHNMVVLAQGIEP